MNELTVIASRRPLADQLDHAANGSRVRVMPGRFDALLPAEMAERAEEIGMTKVAMAPLSLFGLAVLAGAFIALGGVFATTALTGTSGAPWGPVRALAGVAFSLGLVLVLVGGAELFTGNNLIVMAWASGRVTTAALVRNWAIVYAGNFVGAAGTAVLVLLAGTYRGADGAWGLTALRIASAKLQLGLVEAVALGVLCNALVCLAVWLTFSARTTTDRILATVPPISAFVAAGSGHPLKSEEKCSDQNGPPACDGRRPNTVSKVLVHRLCHRLGFGSQVTQSSTRPPSSGLPVSANS